MSDTVRIFSSTGRLVLSRLRAFGPRRSHKERAAASGPRGRLFRKYVLLIVGLVSLVLLLNSAVDFWFGYEENKAALFRIQQEKAASAARRIEQFVDEIERQLGWTTAPQWAAAPLEQRRFDYVRLLRQVPPITELIQLDDNGKEQLKVSRLAMDVVGSEKDYSEAPSFTEARKHRIWFSPVYFRKESEPYMTLAMARTGRNAGVTVAEVNLKLIWDVITGLKIGQGGYAYVVDREGRLIAHPDISLVLRNTDLAALPQVAAARAEAVGDKAEAAGAMVAKDINGDRVLTAHAGIAPLGWTVFVELPLSEALAPLYGSALRMAVLLALALVLATSAALLLARRMTVPIRQLQAGAARIGAGELDRRIEIHTGDELEGLAGDFNRMASDLQKSYADLEKKVEDRTAELKEALDQQTATAEVLGVINSSPGDLAPVFDSMLENALRLCEADFGVLLVREGNHFRTAALRGVPAALAEFLSGTPREPGKHTAVGRMLDGEDFVHFEDMAAERAYHSGDRRQRAFVDLGGTRSYVAVALRKDGQLLGSLAAYRREVRPFTDKQIALLQNFAAQAVIAMENARLLTETREALEQQTATAEVLQVINSSPGDLAPVFQSIVEKAHTLCGAACGSLQLWDGEKFRGVAMRGFPEAMVEQLRAGYSPSDMPCQRLVEGERVVHCVDLAEIDSPVAREGGVKLGGVRTILYVALRKDDVLLGQIVAARQEVRPFSEKEIALVESFAAQAVIAMENARLITETREALEQQTATAEVLGVINSSPGDLAPVFDAMLEKAMHLCGAAFGVLWTHDADRFRPIAHRGLPARFAEFLEHDPPAPEANPGSGHARILAGERLIHVADGADEALYRAGDPYRRALVDLGGARTGLMVPLRKDETVIGCFMIYRQEVRPFSDKQIALLQNFAAQAVIAMENARLITETREALEQQTATAEVLQVINSSPGDLAPVFDAMLEKAMRLCEAPLGILRRFDGEVFRAIAVRGVSGAAAEMFYEPIVPDPGSASERLVRGDEVVHIPDVVDTEAYRSGVASRLTLVEITGARTALWVALRKDDALIGDFVIYRREVRPFSDKQIALLQNLAAQAVIAMENARLITETREALEQQTATAEVLQVINSSPGNLAPVFNVILEKAHTLCGAAHGSLQLYDGENLHAVATHAVSDKFAEILRQGYRAAESPASRALIEGKRFAHIADCAEIDQPVFRNAADFAGIRTVLFVPLRRDNEFLGLISAARLEVRPFSDKQIALLQNFAAQAVIAMENARLITETRETLEQQTATAEVLGVINSSPGNLQPVFDAMLQKALSLCGAVFGGLFIRDGERFYAAATIGLSVEFDDFVRKPFVPAPDSIFRQALGGEWVVHIPDVTQLSTADNPQRKALIEVGGARTQLQVALRKDGVVLGVFNIFRQEVRPFSEKQIALLQNFAAQAVIAMENARLLTETREALEQQTATAEVLQVINSSPGDLAPVFDAMLDKAMRLCSAAFGYLMTYDGERFQEVAHQGLPPRFAEYLPRMDQPGPSGAYARIKGGAPLVYIADLKEGDVYRSSPLRRALVDLGGARTGIVVALRKDEALLGVLTIYRQEVRPFTDKQIALLQNFAAQAVIAMENARLITETREALEQQTATAEVLGVINSSPGDLAPVFDAMLEKAHSLCGIAKGSLELYDGQNFRAVATRGLADAFADELRRGYPASANPATKPLIEGEPFSHILDVAQREFPFTRGPQDAADARTLLCVPLRRDERLLGMIASARREVRPFTDKQIALLQNFAAQAVIAMENARLINELRKRTADLQESLEYQTATSDVLKVISQSGGELQSVLDTLVETATRICVADNGLILRLRDGEYHIAASVGFSPEFKEHHARYPTLPGRGTVTGRVALEGHVVHIADAATDPEYTATRSQELGQTRTMLGVPLFRDRTVTGVITLARSRVEPFTEKEIALGTTFADQAVIAIENARLFNELRARTAELGRSVDELQMLREVGQAVSSTLDLRAVLSTILTRSVGLAGADGGAIFRYNRGERSFRLVEAIGWDAALAEAVGDLRVLETETAMGEAAARRVPIQLADLADRPSAPLRNASLAAGIRGVLIVPLVGPERILGALILQRRATGEFSPETVQLMQTLASQSVLAIQNARLFREIADKSEQLALASQHKSQFLANMSHELRTPLNAILGYAELLVDGIYGELSDRPRGVLERIQNNGKHLLALINDVLDLAKIEAGQLTLTLDDYSLPEVVQSVVTATEPLATAKGLKFTAALQDDLPKAHGDARRVSQVLLNLVGNAIKFTDKGEVEIRAMVDKGQFVLTVRDTGPGIADADQERIFGEFQQIDNSNTRKKGGTGLGLAISRRMVEMQGGTIAVDSVLSQGSTFRVVLPVHVDEMMEAAE